MFNYEIFSLFFEKHKAQGFKNIDCLDPLVVELEEKMKDTRQFFYIGDLIQIRVLYASKGLFNFFGQIPAESYPFAVFEASHPECKQRHSVARAKLIKLGQDMYNNKWEKRFLSTNLTIRNVNGNYAHLAFQGYLTYSEAPYPSVFLVMVHTDIGNIAQIKHGYHFYAGPDESFFRYPDNEMLMTGNVFTDREFEIIKCIADGLNSQQIAEKLFLSIYTVNTHRRNILAKTNKDSTLELVIDLQEKGVI
jgi:DNA-binding CsgD family transcriptional regulator